ncbi:ornithine cyclodeaminase family protein [Streptomyces sp. NPDC086549]|uniref:ornithine cyclodeaminase family protein n=1 Tax=Streptomyces sp. NPDC086549 TaxID=3365752 RepID=UPI003801A9C5
MTDFVRFLSGEQVIRLPHLDAAARPPTVQAVVAALGPVTGELAAVLDGTAVTTPRTAAGSAVAVGAPAVPAGAEPGVPGSGTRAVAHARVIARVREPRTVRLWSPDPALRARAARTLAAGPDLPVHAAGIAGEAVAGASPLAARTLGTTPVVRGEWPAPGCTVVGAGSCEPARREAGTEAVRRAVAAVVDTPREGLPADQDPDPDPVPPGEVLTGRRGARASPDGVVHHSSVRNSVGPGIQDAAAARAVIRAAKEAHT